MINKDFLNIQKRYLFSQIEEKLETVTKRLGKDKIINLGIGDICKPLCPIIKNAFIDAIEQMSSDSGIKGYGPALGYTFLRQAIAEQYYSGMKLDASEVFISDGINTPITEILSIFDKDCSIAIPNPAYPVYLDNAIMKGFQKRILPLALLEENGFNPVPPKERVDIVYLCSPGNPTGTAMSYNELQAWVNWAIDNQAILLFDAAYSCFIEDHDIPKSIFAIPHARQCAIEFMSFSKSAGFSGLRLGSVAISKELVPKNSIPLISLLQQYLETVSNGVSYPVQQAGLAALSSKGQQQVQADILEYKECANTLKKCLIDCGYSVFSGNNTPYLWVRVPEPYSSQEYCNRLLENGLVSIAGSGFGSFGEGYFRLSCFITKETLHKALRFFKKGMVSNAEGSRVLTL